MILSTLRTVAASSSLPDSALNILSLPLLPLLLWGVFECNATFYDYGGKQNRVLYMP
jgi:hypothetical protein